jgi:hypothetical protein
MEDGRRQNQGCSYETSRWTGVKVKPGCSDCRRRYHSLRTRASAGSPIRAVERWPRPTEPGALLRICFFTPSAPFPPKDRSWSRSDGVRSRKVDIVGSPSWLITEACYFTFGPSPGLHADGNSVTDLRIQYRGGVDERCMRLAECHGFFTLLHHDEFFDGRDGHPQPFD